MTKEEIKKKTEIQCILLVNRIIRGLFLKTSTVIYPYCFKNVDLMTITTSTKMTNQLIQQLLTDDSQLQMDKITNKKSTRNVCLFFSTTIAYSFTEFDGE